VLIYRKQVARRTEKTVENALVPAQDLQTDLQVRAQKVSNALVKFTSDRQVYVEKTVGILQKVSLYLIIRLGLIVVLLQTRTPHHQLYRH
jgi:hypothetical protein